MPCVPNNTPTFWLQRATASGKATDYDYYYYDDKSVQPLIESDFDEIVWQLKNGKYKP